MVQLDRVYKIYLVSNLHTEKVYVGRTNRALSLRWKEHVRDSKIRSVYFSKAIKKWGPESFRMRVIRRTFDEKEAYELEKHYILMFKSYDPEYGYNGSFGGDGAGIPTEETKCKLSLARLGPKHFLWGKHRSQDTKRKLREANLGKNSPVYRHDLPDDEIARLYAEKKSLRFIGALFGADNKTIADRLESLGIARRPHWQKFQRPSLFKDRRFSRSVSSSSV